MNSANSPAVPVKQAIDRLQHHAQRSFEKTYQFLAAIAAAPVRTERSARSCPILIGYARLIEEGGDLGQLCQIRTKQVFGVGIGKQATA